MSPRISSEKTPTVIVLSSAGETKTSEYRNSFQDRVKANRAAQITPGTATGRRILTRVWNRLHPSSMAQDRKSTRLNSSHSQISYAVFCLKKKKKSHELFTDSNILNIVVLI